MSWTDATLVKDASNDASAVQASMIILAEAYLRLTNDKRTGGKMSLQALFIKDSNKALDEIFTILSHEFGLRTTTIELTSVRQTPKSLGNGELVDKTVFGKMILQLKCSEEGIGFRRIHYASHVARLEAR
ncbi:hypothetical protein Tco_0689994 [Tanacetum coccineum]